MTPKVLPSSLPGLALSTDALPDAVVRRPAWRPMRGLRRRMAWLLLIGWVVLPLLPALGIGLSALLGVGLF